MNKPAPREPSMDEILSSIRQIIADDDAAGAPRRPLVQPAPAVNQAPQAMLRTVPSEPFDAPEARETFAEREPLALSPSQIVEDEPAAEETETMRLPQADAPDAADQASSWEAPRAEALQELVEPEDIDFDADSSEDDEPVAEARPEIAAAPAEPEARRPEPAPSPLPDPNLSSDIAERLLEPATNAAVRANFARINALGLGTPGLTIETMVRDLLRPMLKEWLDENLPAVVERMVEREIARLARGE